MRTTSGLELRNQNKQRIKELSQKIRNGIIKDRKVNRLHILEKHITRTGGTKKALKNLKETSSWIPNLNYNSINPIRKITNRKEINRIATSFYRSLYSNQHAIDQKTRTSPKKWNSKPKILPSEVRKAIASQKSDKAPGPDGITNEILKGTLESMVPLLTKIYNDIQISGYISEQWE
ncbi:LINE-1 retrotransposable element ORF2 protein [Eumeta japonica]|uniref:LINE-1 retrotransposable element ORF2 protein n=1 Tax=Eumeta variegata TaxID=151549 RepID=A0A4C1UR45_EUMVA|nr:LINE-1 retrotransposable element ORF2 protein [Eumeta japonica]